MSTVNRIDSPPRPHRPRPATTALVSVAVSAIGLIATNVGVLMNAKGFQSKSNVQTPVSDALFLTFIIGAVAATLAGGAAYLRSRGRTDNGADNAQ